MTEKAKNSSMNSNFNNSVYEIKDNEVKYNVK